MDGRAPADALITEQVLSQPIILRISHDVGDVDVISEMGSGFFWNHSS